METDKTKLTAEEKKMLRILELAAELVLLEDAELLKELAKH